MVGWNGTPAAHVRDNDLWARSAYVPNKGDVLVVRADLSKRPVREAVEALDDARQSLVDSSRRSRNCALHYRKPTSNCRGLVMRLTKQTIALAKLRAHLEGRAK